MEPCRAPPVRSTASALRSLAHNIGVRVEAKENGSDHPRAAVHRGAAIVATDVGAGVLVLPLAERSCCCHGRMTRTPTASNSTTTIAPRNTQPDRAPPTSVTSTAQGDCSDGGAIGN